MSEQPDFSEVRKCDIETETKIHKFDQGVKRHRPIEKTGHMDPVPGSLQVFCQVQHSVVLSPDDRQWKKRCKDQYAVAFFHILKRKIRIQALTAVLLKGGRLPFAREI